MFSSQKSALFLLKIAVALPFAYAGIASLLRPNDWIGFLPPEMLSLASSLSPFFVLTVFAIIEIVLALWILSGKWLAISSLLAALMLVGIIAANYKLIDILFRDLSIVFAALALFAFRRSA